MSISCVRAGLEIQMASYASKHASQSLSDKHFYAYSVLGHITWKLQVVHECSAYQTTVILSEIFFLWFRVALEIRLESYGPRHTSIVLWYHIACVYILQAHIYIRYLVRNNTWQQNSHTLWLHTTHQMTALLPTMHCFIRTKLSSYTIHVTVSFQLIVYAILKITTCIRGTCTTIPLYEFAVKQPKKNLNYSRGKKFSVKIDYN